MKQADNGYLYIFEVSFDGHKKGVCIAKHAQDAKKFVTAHYADADKLTGLKTTMLGTAKWSSKPVYTPYS